MKIDSITKLSATIVAAALAFGQPSQSDAAILVLIPGVGGDSTIEASDDERNDLIVIENVTHELNRDAETGEISEVIRIQRYTDDDSPTLLQAFLDGTEFPELLIASVETDSEGKPLCYLKYKLDRCFVKSWSTSGDADDRPTEEVAFYYNKIAFAYAPTDGGKSSDANATALMSDSFSFAVEREMKESGEKGGTADINIGIGELQEATTGDANLDGRFDAEDLNTSAAGRHVIREIVPNGAR